MKTFKKGDIIYLGVLDGKKLVCTEARVYDTEGLIQEAGYVDPLGIKHDEEGLIQRIYYIEEGEVLYLDYQVDGEEAAISTDKGYVIKALRELKPDWPLYIKRIDSIEEIIENGSE